MLLKTQVQCYTHCEGAEVGDAGRGHEDITDDVVDDLL